SSFASTWPACTASPSRTSIERTMEASSGCSTMVGARETTRPCAVTTRSTLITPIATMTARNMLEMIHTMPRAERGTGVVVITVDGIWNSRMTGRVGSCRSSATTAVLIALDEGRGERGMTRTLAVEVAVLLRPELAIDGAAFEQDAVRCDVHHLALLQHQD